MLAPNLLGTSSAEANLRRNSRRDGLLATYLTTAQNFGPMSDYEPLNMAKGAFRKIGSNQLQASSRKTSNERQYGIWWTQKKIGHRMQPSQCY